jgi:hypothetical protein
MKPRETIALAGLLAFGGCATQAQFLRSKQAMAMRTAGTRGRFEMNCPSATGTLIPQEVVRPALRGPWVAGIQRAEYTIGISGCGQRTTFIVVCPEGGEGCFAAGPGPFHSY